jgi:hypothetical protein
MTEAPTEWLQRAAALRELVTLTRNAWVQTALRRLARYCELQALDVIRKRRKTAQIIPFRRPTGAPTAERIDGAS